ncbi:MAG TPA: catalase family peroxidase [Candidatus Acidoferrales bacterium]|jgi:catalase|nr:catalase family peroxidase [Candidatus Acidoferrales bacterium]
MPLPPLSKTSLISRLLAIGLVFAIIVGLFAYAAGWLTPHTLTPEGIIQRFQSLNGIHSGFRRNHAKGVCFSGSFDSNGQGVTLSKAVVFQSGHVPVIGRFSFGGGMPYAADDPATVRGLAVLFKLPDGEEWRTAMVNLPVFPAATPQAFYDLLLATAPDPATGKPDPARIKMFFTEYPESAKAIQLLHGQPPSSGFENSTFNSLNAFRFIDSSGAVVWGRWSVVPVQPFKPMDAAHPEQTDTNYLFDALIAAIHEHPLQWHLVITLAQPGDPTDDATLPWPADRKQVDVGTLTINDIESEDTSPARDVNFDPLVLPSGIAASDDPLLSARSAVYARSYTLREGEHKDPSAVSAAETAK